MSNYGNSFQRTTPVVLNLIIINALVFLVQNLFDGPEGKITNLLALYPVKSGLFEPYQLITHMFTHGGFAHILFNMFALWSFGSLLERVWGPKRFLIFFAALRRHWLKCFLPTKRQLVHRVPLWVCWERLPIYFPIPRLLFFQFRFP